MDWLGQGEEQSRLGQILLGKRLISEQQLAQAIDAQLGSGKRLGQVLAELRLLTDAQLQSAVRRQRNLRMAAALGAALLGPVQALAGTVSGAAPAVARSGGMRVLADAELGQVAGQGDGDDALRLQARQAERLLAALQQLRANAPDNQDKSGGQAVRVVGELAALVNPLFAMLAADVTMSGVVFDPGKARAVVNKDGSVTFCLPSSIGEIQLKNIRVSQAADGPGFGMVQLRDIDLRGSSITVRRLGG